MNVNILGEHVFVTLSQRNMLHLQKGFESGFAEGLVRRCEDGISLHVRMESDADHYGEREPGPGLGHEV